MSPSGTTIFLYCLVALVGVAILGYTLWAFKMYRENLRSAYMRRRERNQERTSFHHEDNYWAVENPSRPPEPTHIKIFAR
jgi:hypothetical protein